jgi:hypothetical protein
VLALFAALAMGMPGTFGMGSMMGVGGFGLVTVVWTVAVGALGGAIAWTYNAIAGEQIAETSDLLRQPGISRPGVRDRHARGALIVD